MYTKLSHQVLRLKPIKSRLIALNKECIESILAQRLKPLEIIICDDHSLDGTWEIIMRYWRRYPALIRPFRHRKNVGPARNGIFGQKKIKGDLYAWIDGDD